MAPQPVGRGQASPQTPKRLRTVALFSAAVAAAAAVLFHVWKADALLTAAVTSGTVAYHFGMRLLVGYFYNMGMKNRADCTKQWYQTHPWEEKLFRLLRVKKWKGKLPAYDPQAFSPERHTLREIAQAMCQSELVHETNFVLSFVPLLFSRWFGAFAVFLLTSLCGGLIDLLFVLVQRYNRPRVLRLAARESRR